MPPSANRGAEGLLRFAAILLPMAFVLMQISSTHRVSAPTVKLSVKLVGCCAVAAFMFALTMSSNNDLVPHDHFRTHAQRSSPVPSTAILRHLYRTKHQHSANSAGASSGVILERNRMRLICATPTCDDDRLLDEAFEAWLHSQQKDTVSPLRIANRPKAALPKELDALLEDALHEVQRCSSPAFENTPIGSFPHTPEGACVPSTPDFAQFHELSATSSIRAGPLSGSRRMSSDMDIASTSSRSDATPLGEVTKRWRHNPYTFRGFTLMDVDAHHHTVPITIRNGETSLVHDVRLDVLLKASQPPIDLRRRGKVNMEPKPPKNETAVPAAATPANKDSARAANPDAALARKNFKKACEQIKMPIEEPLYSVVVKLPSTAGEIPSNWVASIDEGWTTLTGLPNADGHRVAEALLKHYEAIGVIRGEYSLSNDVRRMDRFNTGACHVMFNDTADAQRMQLQLRNDMVFAAFRDGRCVVSGAMD